MKPVTLMSEPRSGLVQALAQAILALVLVTLLNGCRDAGLGELQHTLDEGSAAPGTIPDGAELAALPEPVSGAPVGYLFDDGRNPFEAPGVPPEVAVVKHSGITPDDGRLAEPLEAFSLDELILVGTLTFGGRSSALVRDPAGKVHRLSVGSRMGADFGRITEITSSAVHLMETVPAGGGWVERASTLVLGD